jgi:NAD(P)-dependent dehydrogenase (short-subunit alcohol dehydrogenase family)
MKTVVVTGVSTGIGRAAAQVLLDKGFRVFGSVRNAHDAVRLKGELGAHFTPLLFDVTDPEAVGDAADQVKEALGGKTLYGLVNNAGIAVPGPLLHLKIEDFRRQLDVNLTGQLIVIQAFAPLLDGKHPGRIVMISSIGGKNASPFVGPYNTSKFGIEGFSESLRRELMVYGIDVIVIAPGAIATPIWDKAEAVDVAPYAGTVYAPALHKTKTMMVDLGRKGLPAKKIGLAIWRALTVPHPKTRYTITPDPIVTFAMRVLPKRWADRIYARMLGLSRNKGNV